MMSGPVYYVEIRYDIGGSNNIPHTFFVITKPDGSSREYGFAPLEEVPSQGMAQYTKQV